MMIKNRIVLLFILKNTGCRGEDLNLHGFPRWILNPVRIPFRHLGINIFYHFRFEKRMY